MNVADMLERIAQKTSYDPGTATHRAELVAHLNEAQSEVFDAEAWNFATKDAEVQVYADRTLSVSVVAGTPNVNDASGTGVFEDWMQGQLIELEGVDHYILDVVSSTVLRLTENYPNNLTSVAGVVKNRFISLPEDCEQLVNIGRRSSTSPPGSEDRLYEPLSRGADRAWNLDLSSTGTPECFIPADDVTVAPRVAPPAMALAAGGALPLGDIEVVVTHHDMHGRHSAPTPPVTLTTTSGQQTINVTLETLGTARTLGIRRAIWVKPPGYNGFRLIEKDIDESVMTRSLTALPPTNWQLLERLRRHDGNYQTVRLYPRQAEDASVLLTYRRRPSLLEEDTDTPELPARYHEYLVNRVLMDEGWVTLNNPVMAATYAKKVDRQFRAMSQRHLDKAPKPIVKGGRGRGPNRRIARFLNAVYNDRN